MTPAEVRPLFPITASRAYLFSGGLAPAAAPVRAAMDRWTDLWALDPAFLYAHYHEEWDYCRRRFADVIGADVAEVAIVDNTSRASNLAADMIDAQAGANVVVDEFTYPSSRYPWHLPGREDVEIRHVAARENRVGTDELAAAIDDRTVAVSISHVSPRTGFRHDLAAVAELAHARGALLFVDAAQSAGVIDVDVRRQGVDMLACGAMKWLLGAPGIGYLFVRRGLAERLSPPHVGYAGVIQPPPNDRREPLALKPGALRHEIGMPSLPGLYASRVGMDLLLGVGIASIERHVAELVGRCLDELRRRNLRVLTRPEPELRAGIVALEVARGDEVVAFLRARAVDVWTNTAKTLLRIDPHVFNNQDDLDRLLGGIDEFLRAGGRSAL